MPSAAMFVIGQQNILTAQAPSTRTARLKHTFGPFGLLGLAGAGHTPLLQAATVRSPGTTRSRGGDFHLAIAGATICAEAVPAAWVTVRGVAASACIARLWWWNGCTRAL